MTFAADYPFLNILWTMIIFFAWVAWIWTLVVIIGDLFRRQDASGWTKAMWMIFLVLIPFIGVLCYLIANSGSMAQRAAELEQSRHARFQDEVRAVAGSNGGGGVATELERAKGLLDSGAITQAEFGSLKTKLLT